MITPTSISEQLLFTTVRIEIPQADGSTSVGTGFFFNFAFSEFHVPVLITNKHVALAGRDCKLLLHERGDALAPSGTFFTLHITDHNNLCISHPDNDLDLCCMLLAPVIADSEKQGRKIFFINLDESIIPSQTQLSDLTAMEDVIMVGYPIGLFDHANNLPLIRKGITATHPAVNFDGRPFGMVDIGCFPGSSGSPIFVINELGYISKGKGVILGRRAFFLGVLFAGPQMTVEGKITIVDIPTVARSFSVSHVPSNLGIYLKSRVLGDFRRILEERVKLQREALRSENIAPLSNASGLNDVEVRG